MYHPDTSAWVNPMEGGIETAFSVDQFSPIYKPMAVQSSKDELLDVLQDDPLKAQALYDYWVRVTSQ